MTPTYLPPGATISPESLTHDDRDRLRIYTRAQKSACITSSVAAPGAGVTIATIPGFKTDKTGHIYRIDWVVFYTVAQGPALDMELVIGGRVMILPIPAIANMPIMGTIFAAPDHNDIQINSLVGSATATYVASMTATRLVEAVQAVG